MEENIVIAYGIKGFVKENKVWLELTGVIKGLGFPLNRSELGGTIKWKTVDIWLAEVKQRLGEKVVCVVGAQRYIIEDAFYILSIKSNSKQARDFQIKILDKVVPEIKRKGNSVIIDLPKKQNYLYNIYRLSEEAKSFGVREKDLIKVLHDNGYLYKFPRMPWRPCIGKEHYFKTIEAKKGKGYGKLTFIRPSGIKICEELLDKECNYSILNNKRSII